jgi:hypothetical protein
MYSGRRDRRPMSDLDCEVCSRDNRKLSHRNASDQARYSHTRFRRADGIGRGLALARRRDRREV